MKLEKYFSHHTVDDAINAMIYYAKMYKDSPEIKNAIEIILPGVNLQDYPTIFATIRNYIKNTMQYVPDGDEARLFGFDGSDLELVKSPKAILESGRYDCDCASTLIASILLSLCIPVRFVIISTLPFSETGPGGWTHVYTEGYDSNEKKWVVIDPVSHPDEKQMILDTKQHKIYNII